MGRSLQQRICKAEQLLDAVKEKHEEQAEQMRFCARLHATLVAAIVLAGKPKMNEPLGAALRRALQHYRIPALLQDAIAARSNGSEKSVASFVDQIEAVEVIAPAIIGEGEESTKLTEIFRNAPSWLLNFTRTTEDAEILKFKLPDKLSKSKWGSRGYEDSRAWPLLPVGRITDGDPISDASVQRWPRPLGWREENLKLSRVTRGCGT